MVAPTIVDLLIAFKAIVAITIMAEPPAAQYAWYATSGRKRPAQVHVSIADRIEECVRRPVRVTTEGGSDKGREAVEFPL